VKIIERKFEGWRHGLQPDQLNARSVDSDIADAARENAGVLLNEYFRLMVDGSAPLAAAFERLT
jgi:hypothetical protein